MQSSDRPVEKNTLFPIFLKLENLHLLIVGGGKVGLEKLNAVLANAPTSSITLVGKEILPEIKNLAKQHPSVTLKEQAFTTANLDGKDVTIIATNDAEENRSIYKMTKAKHILVNVADTPPLCDFYLGSIVQKGHLKIAISTNGQSPTLAKRLREVFTEVFPDEIASVLHHLKDIRDSLQGDFDYKVKKLNEITALMAERVPKKTLKK